MLQKYTKKPNLPNLRTANVLICKISHFKSCKTEKTVKLHYYSALFFCFMHYISAIFARKQAIDTIHLRVASATLFLLQKVTKRSSISYFLVGKT